MEASVVVGPSLPQPVRLYLASREMRLHYYLWHGVRDGWLTRFSDETKGRFREIGWKPPRPSLRLDDNGNRRIMIDAPDMSSASAGDRPFRRLAERGSVTGFVRGFQEAAQVEGAYLGSVQLKGLFGALGSVRLTVFAHTGLFVFCRSLS